MQHFEDLGESYYKYRGDRVAAHPYDPLIGRVIYDFCKCELKRIPRSITPGQFVTVLVSIPSPVTVGTVIGAAFFIGKKLFLHHKASTSEAVLPVGADIFRLLDSHDIKVSIG